MHTPRKYADQCEELKALAKGFEIPVFNTLIKVLRNASSVKAAAAELDKLSSESRLRATQKFALAAKLVRAQKKLDAQSMQMK
ncbi:hypothetical protein PLCT2_00262 [Planctomycetaceae bacterium]|nr:hypothetical protein PLCT2_00262 [Planctomycetaceae bacterium]